MKNLKTIAVIAIFAGLSVGAYAQGSGQGKMNKYGGGSQQAGQGSHQGGGTRTQTHTQSRTQDGTHVGGEAALRDRMRSQTPTTGTTVTQ